MDQGDNRHNVTGLLLKWQAGSEDALKELIPMIYDELRIIARSQLRKERANHTFKTDGLVNEAFLKMWGQRSMNIRSRAHFFGIAARAMRQILVDYARELRTEKRGGAFDRLYLDNIDNLSKERPVDLISLDEALDELQKWDPQKCRMVEMRYFAGLTNEQTAQVLGISVATVKREWTFSRSWLKRKMSEEKTNSNSFRR
jgi:RNA polymerase sigma factor (TIGR02999 family)